MKEHLDTVSISSYYEKKRALNAVKQPVYLTSTFAFHSAEEGEQFFKKWTARDGSSVQRDTDTSDQFIYSRLSNPNLELYEKRMAQWDQCEVSLLFSSGMAAITTTHMTLVKQGDVILSSSPVYASVNEYYEIMFKKFGVENFVISTSSDDFIPRLRDLMFNNEIVFQKLRLIHLESPANPTNKMIDIVAVCKLRDELNQRRKTLDDDTRVLVTIDNTFMGPVFQTPKLLGADIILHSATKFLGGHGDLIAGTCSGPKYLMNQIKQSRKILGCMCDPFTAFLLLRSMETLSLRMHKQADNAVKIAKFLKDYNPNLVYNVIHPSLLDISSDQYRIFKNQCTGYGSLIAFEIRGGQKSVFRFLNALKVINLAVSLGGTESNCQHPWSGTHAQLTEEQRRESGVTEGLIRFSVGIEHVDDLIEDLRNAFDSIKLVSRL
jgi:methionine-gamma-lyase